MQHGDDDNDDENNQRDGAGQGEGDAPAGEPDIPHEPMLHDDELGALLPFYLAGRLDLADHERVQKWIEGTPAGRRALERARRRRRTFKVEDFLSSELGALQPLPEAPRPAAEPRAAPPAGPLRRLLGAFDRLLARLPHGLVWVLVAALLLLALLRAGLVPLP
jgi:anti-sigma factor RsiW